MLFVFVSRVRRYGVFVLFVVVIVCFTVASLVCQHFPYLFVHVDLSCITVGFVV